MIINCSERLTFGCKRDIIIFMKDRTYDAVLLLGLKLKDGAFPEEEMILRVKKAAEAYRLGMADKIIACGGRFHETEKTEAEVMEALLLSEGVPASAILCEDKSRITYENIENAKAFLCESKPRVLVVTSDYHARRARLLCRMMGIKADCMPAETPDGPEKRAKKRLEFLFTIDTLLGNQRPGKKRGKFMTAVGKLTAYRSMKKLGRDVNGLFDKKK